MVLFSGGLIALHNASSYGHLEIAALLIKYNTQVNAVDKWHYTPLMGKSRCKIQRTLNERRLLTF